MVDVKDLWKTGVDVKPENYDFYEQKYPEDWELGFMRTDEEIDNQEFEPMMNFFYPLPEFERKHLSDDKIKKALDAAGSVTLVHKVPEDEYGLALTGGGMDLSWDIVKGYIALGYLPPLHFCESLPHFGGMKLGPDEKLVIDACRLSAEHVGQRAEIAEDSIDHLEKWLKEERRR